MQLSSTLDKLLGVIYALINSTLGGDMRSHPLFSKYTRDYISHMTGYSKAYLSRVFRGKTPLSRYFVERVSYSLREHPADLFLPEVLRNDQRREKGKSAIAAGEGLKETQQKTKAR